MGRRGLSARRLSMSPAAKRLLREKKRKAQHNLGEKQSRASTKSRWILAIATLLAFAIAMALIEAMGGFTGR